MKQLREKYFEAVRMWDRKHRIVGKKPIEVLYRESLQSLRKLGRESPHVHLVDIGAGSGVQGMPWLFTGTKRKVVFVEPDLKKAAFLRLFLSSNAALSKRSAVIATPVESVSRETIEGALKDGDGKFAFTVRAFSSQKTLQETLRGSWIENEAIHLFTASETDEFSLTLLK